MKAQRGMMNRKPGVSPDAARPGIYTGCWKLDRGTKMLILCPRSRKMLGLRANQELKVSDFFKLLPPEQVNQMVREFKYSYASDTKFEVQVKVNTLSGKIKWFRITGVPFYRQWGTAEQMVGVIEDTTQLVNEECLSLAVVNHELRSPLTVIKLNVQLLINMLSSGLDKHPVRLLNTVDLHINCMTSLIEEYLTSPVNDLREGEPNRTVFCLDDLICILLSEMKMLHPGYRFIKQNEAKVLVRADKYKIVQVFINYLTNAVKFSPPASRITISTVTTNTCLEVAIRDQGIGIPAGQEAQLFQKFYQGDTRSIRKKNSKGLGLYLVKKIITEHDGTVRAEKGCDGGSVFYFSLPIYAGQNHELAVSAGQRMER
jgi:two-component system sensor histidine kinase VicK